MVTEETKLHSGLKRNIFKIPHPFVILTSAVAIMAMLTYIIPAGVYDRITNDEGVEVLDPKSYHLVESTPVSILQFLTAIPRGYVEAGWIIALCFFVGAAFEVINRIGIIPAMVESLARRFSTKRTLIIPVLVFVFALIDAFIGTPELIIMYVPIVMPLMRRLGFDSVTGVAVVLCGSAAGFSAAMTNPFTIVIGQTMSGLPVYSGWQFRIVMFFVTTIFAAGYVMYYGYRILKNPEKSLTYASDREALEKDSAIQKHGNSVVLGFRERVAGIFSLAIFGFMVVGMILWKWDLPEMCAAFLVIGIGAGLIVRMNTDTMCETMMLGAQNMMLGALVIAISRAISVVMTDGQIVDTAVHTLAGVLSQLPPSVTVFGVLAGVTLLNFLIPSGSGKAVILFPILSPLADAVGVTRQTMVLTYQFGDGFTNVLWPTVGQFMAALVLAGVSWTKWFRFYFPLLIIFLILSAVYLMIAEYISYGPF
ncbi:YfcC family protein [Brevibacterium sp. CFH 10365]|uniref:YfcC family protein n=1 Tax=Brevibacterium sp. CFH 10365 TaxID=2585207 RepID=UPI0012664500|nr:AbgT family transporter [Brevibacterium sp. CFH 10365]